jgi:hypothetical protein
MASSNAPKDQKTGYDPRRDFRLVTESSQSPSSSRARTNHSRIMSRIDALHTYSRYPWQFATHPIDEHTGYRRYDFDRTIILPAGYGGRTWRGQGHGTTQGAGNVYTPTFQMSADQTYAKTTFAGTTNSRMTSSGASNVMTFVGRTVVDRFDVDGSLRVTGGTNATAGYYGIVSVDVEDNTVTLDRNWCTGAVTNGAGYYCPDLIRDYSKANCYESLRFFGTGDDTKAAKGLVGYHGYGNPGGAGVNTCRHTFRDCYFDGFEVGVLAGRSLSRWGEAFPTNPEEPAFAGSNDNNGDHLVFDTCDFAYCDSAFLNRSSQAVGHTFRTAYVNECKVFLDVECGGKIFVDGVHLQGPAQTYPWHRLLRLGRAVGESTNMFTFRDVSMDATCFNPQLVVSDWSSVLSAGSVSIHDVKIQRHANSTLPLFDIQGGVMLTLDVVTMGDSGGKGRLMAKDFKLRDGASSTKTYTIVRNAHLGETLANLVKYPSLDCQAGHVIDFMNCKDYANALVHNKRLTTNAATGEGDARGVVTDI